ncbi:hypothetical protein [Pedobacter deserti]|uniref:hypothetical protein n=1 Tax=Pedobacter deserti TaxID=2817382 RepID=UPI00210A3460|nr:hypothetical protein [Pedobacter sp. SYSU D00382]
MEASLAKMSYELERQNLIREFKSETFDSAKEKRQARRELKEDLRELKKDYEEELKK